MALLSHFPNWTIFGQLLLVGVENQICPQLVCPTVLGEGRGEGKQNWHSGIGEGGKGGKREGEIYIY